MQDTALPIARRLAVRHCDVVLTAIRLRSTRRFLLLNVGRFGGPTLGELAASTVVDLLALRHSLKPFDRDRLSF